MPEAAISSLSRHIDQAWLVEAYRRTRKDGAVGIDGQTAVEYAEELSEASFRGGLTVPTSSACDFNRLR